MTQPTGLQTLLVSEGSNHAFWNNHYVIIWKKAITEEGIRVLDKGMAELAAARPTGIGALLVVEPTAELPPSEIWQKIAAIMSRHTEIKASATVFEGKGLKQAIYRTVTTTVNLLTTRPTPTEVFSTSAAGIDWLVATVGASDTAGARSSDFLAAVEVLRKSAPTASAA